MDHLIFTMAIKGAAILGAIAVGFMQLHYGCHLFQLGDGETMRQHIIKVGELEVGTSSTGVAVMALCFP